MSANASRDSRPHCQTCVRRPRGKAVVIATRETQVVHAGVPVGTTQRRTTGLCRQCVNGGMIKALPGVTSIVRSVGWRVSNGLWTRGRQ